MSQRKYQSHPEMQYEDIEKLVNDLSDEDKKRLAQRLIGKGSPLTVVLGVCNVVNNSPVSLQLNGDLKSTVDQLRQLPDDKLKLLIDALAEVISPS